jgi:hypothetical protein
MEGTPTSFGPLRLVTGVAVIVGAVALAACAVGLLTHHDRLAVGALIVLLATTSVALMADSDASRRR